MLLRKAGYAGAVYREQYENKLPNLFPVIAFVLYWGERRWKSSRSTRRLFRKRELQEEKWKYIDEMKLHVFEMRFLPEETRKMFQSDMRIVVDFLAEGEGYRSQRKIVHKGALIRMLKVLSGETDIESVEKWMEENQVREEDEITVCELFDQYVRQGRAEGEKKGIEKGIEKGESRLAKLVQALMEEGRDEDLRRALSDRSFRQQLYRAFLLY